MAGSRVHHGDCLEVMAAMEAESVDAIVTDPPYGLEFMGQEWDRLWRTDEAADDKRGRGNRTRWLGNGRPSPRYEAGAAAQAWHQRWAEAAYRVAKPSAYLLAFGGTRTVHRMTVAIEDAGWIIRDMLVWGYASGFPKSKASLKPAWEPIVMARKPGPLRMLAIDACRIPMSSGDAANIDSKHAGMDVDAYQRPVGTSLQLSTEPMPLKAAAAHELGRWPANIILTDPIFDGGIEGVVGGGETGPAGTAVRCNGGGGDFFGGINPKFKPDVPWDDMTYGDSGTYSRFFLIPKADRADREPIYQARASGEGALANGRHIPNSQVSDAETLSGGENAASARIGKTADGGFDARGVRANHHPTVKPTDLMRHLIRLVTPTGGTVLDPFLGSGTTAIAAEMEGFDWIGIEKEAEYVAIAEARLNGVQRGMGLPA